MRQFSKGKTWYIALLVPLIFSVVYFLSCILMKYVGSLAATVMMEITLAVIWFVLVRRFGLVPERSIKVKLWQVVVGVCVVCLFYISMTLSANAVYTTFGDVLFDNYTAERVEMSATSQVLTLFITVIAAPVSEELMFRGGMYGALRKTSLPKFIGAMISAATFAFAHGTFVHLLPAFMTGLLCAAIYELTGRLWCSILVHSVYNTMSFFAAGVVILEFLGTWFAVVIQILFWLVVIGLIFFLAYRHCCKVTNSDERLC